MQKQYRVLGLGASYGSLFAIKLVLAGHKMRLVCLPTEVEVINAEGIRVRMPVKGHEGLVEVDSRRAPGELSASGSADVNPADYDLVALAMQEPQYRSPGVRELLAAHRQGARSVHVDHEHAAVAVPCAHPRLGRASAARLLHRPGSVGRLRSRAGDALQPGPAGVPSAGREDQRAAGELADQFQGRALSVGSAHRDAARPAGRHRSGALRRAWRLPVKLKVHDSVFVPLAKWSMLLTGNYRCVQTGEVRSIREAVHSDLVQSREVYNWVSALCRKMGAAPDDQVPFEKYAAAASGLARPSSAARALANGAPNIERVDSLVQRIAAERGMHLDTVDTVVAAVDQRLAENRRPK